MFCWEKVANEWLMLQIPAKNVCKVTKYQPHFITIVYKKEEWWKSCMMIKSQASSYKGKTYSDKGVLF